jgi:hypothetical protein
MFPAATEADTPNHSARRRAALALLCALACGLSEAAPAATAAPRVTLLEGSSGRADVSGAIMVDGARAGAVVVGLALKAQALLETPPGTALLRIEFADGSIADLGPQTRVMVQPAGFAPRGGKPPLVYLLSGWMKLASPADTATAGLISPELDVPPFTGTIIVQAAPKLHRIFVETGRAEVVEPRAGGARSALGNGQMYTARVVSASGGIVARPSGDFLASLPRLFRDRIPCQAARLKDTCAEAAPSPAPCYAALREWLVAEPAIRRDFPRRFAELARSGPFRRGSPPPMLFGSPCWPPQASLQRPRYPTKP